ncbi:MAG: decaprenyl-phosphate phosphoribosyltransferase [Kiritimatiellae bacterium]|nr:decaprenyl-phosphate phosphoribosyltransferase [Kiritimatiellia bacterium]
MTESTQANDPSNRQTPTAIDLVRALRPKQWTKNAIVLAAFFFAFWDQHQQFDLSTSILKVSSAMILFCLASSAIYILNDIIDTEADRNHPTKKFRPIVAGRIKRSLAWQIFSILLITAGGGSMLLSPPFFCIIVAYITIQTAYCLILKHIPTIDVMVIAIGFVLRAIAGALVLSIVISPWLLLCTFLLALFLALCKRRHEKTVLDNINGQRQSLDKYDAALLDKFILITSSATIVSYSIYTLSEATIDKFGTTQLGFTIPFVIFGIFRYLDLVYRHEQGDRPERILLTDLPILINLLLYVISIVLIFVF